MCYSVSKHPWLKAFMRTVVFLLGSADPLHSSTISGLGSLEIISILRIFRYLPCPIINKNQEIPQVEKGWKNCSIMSILFLMIVQCCVS